MWAEVEKRGNRYLELKQKIEDPKCAGSPEYTKLLREFGRLTKLGESYAKYIKCKEAIEEAKLILEDPESDQDFKELAQEESEENKAEMEKLERELIDYVVGQDEDSDRNVIVEIYAGVGGDEAALFVNDLFEMYKRFADQKTGWKVVLLNVSPSDLGGFKEISFRVIGEGAFGEFRFEGGGHRVQRVPKTETQGRIHTSMARVAVLPEAEDVDVEINPRDVEEKFCASGGPGGQNVNKVATQCQLTHIPTGIQVRCMETRSQRQNRERAWQILRSKIYAIKKAEAEQERSDNRLGQIGSGDRSERVRTYNFPQGRCTDHRLQGEAKNWSIQDIMNGNLQDLLDKLKEARKLQATKK